MGDESPPVVVMVIFTSSWILRAGEPHTVLPVGSKQKYITMMVMLSRGTREYHLLSHSAISVSFHGNLLKFIDITGQYRHHNEDVPKLYSQIILTYIMFFEFV